MDQDFTFLHNAERPFYEEGDGAVRVVDLFAGCGGLTLGIAEAAKRFGLAVDIPLAIESDPGPSRVFHHNFPKARVQQRVVEELFDGEIGDPPSAAEMTTTRELGREGIDWLVAGPPCQGHSNLNNYTRRNDPKNRLYFRVARAAEVLKPSLVLVENVPAVQFDEEGVVGSTEAALSGAGYVTAARVLDLSRLGVPQRRNRHVLLAMVPELGNPDTVLKSLEVAEPRNLQWAINDLVQPPAGIGFDSPSKMSPENQQRAKWLIENDEYDLPNSMRPPCHRGEHTYQAMYGRLAWNTPPPTITSGFMSMGQGRFLHPDEPRTLTPREAARIQFFPDWFDFTAGGLEGRRTAWGRMIGNAVPPKLTLELGLRLLPRIAISGS